MVESKGPPIRIKRKNSLTREKVRCYYQVLYTLCNVAKFSIEMKALKLQKMGVISQVLHFYTMNEFYLQALGKNKRTNVVILLIMSQNRTTNILKCRIHNVMGVLKIVVSIFKMKFSSHAWGQKSHFGNYIFIHE